MRDTRQQRRACERQEAKGHVIEERGDEYFDNPVFGRIGMREAINRDRRGTDLNVATCNVVRAPPEMTMASLIAAAEEAEAADEAQREALAEAVNKLVRTTR